jgi:hypothetical protein
MDDQAPKRRRTSPQASLLAGQDARTTNEAEAEADVTPTSPRKRPPSFTSPTKASLAKHNPDVLKRRKAAKKATKAGQDAQSASRPSSRDSEEGLAALLTAQLEAESETGGSQMGDRQERNPSTVDNTQTRPSSLQKISGALSTRPKRSPNKPNPRPLPPPSQETDEDVLNPFAGRSLPRSPATGVIPVQQTLPEPELPPTPTQRGLKDPVVTTPPSGIHNTPSKRSRNTTEGGKMRSSPLKQPPLRPTGQVKSAKISAHLSTGGKLDRGEANPLGSSNRKADPLRKVLPFDPFADLRKERDSLKAELSRLKSDLASAEQENERIRILQLNPQQPLSTTAIDRTELLALLRRHLLTSDDKPVDEPSQKLLTAALNPIAWLPFSKVISQPINLLDDAETDQPAPISHHPIGMTKQEEAPFLQAFTPFEFKSTKTMVQRQHDDDPILQKHVIAIRTTHPPGLFAATVEMTVNTKAWSISEISVPNLVPTAAAELRPFIDKIVNGSSNSAVLWNISILTWAMSEWYHSAMKRASLWLVLERELGNEVSLRECVTSMRSRKRKRRRREDNVDDADLAGGYRDTVQQKHTTETFKKTDLWPYMGCTSFNIPVPDDSGDAGSCLRIQWHIEFDWSGEAINKIGLLVGIPGKCKRERPFNGFHTS